MQSNIAKMKITLTNFGCYLDKTFDFGHKGAVLLSGKSGSGKTTLIKAIYFALYGSGYKVITYGKTSCTVDLELEGMNIVRSKRPNRLVVDNIHEDDSAQEIINKKFGNSFNVTSYISQNNKDSFILMSPLEKLGFLERFAFQNINLGHIKKRCKNLITEKKEVLIKTSAQLEMSTNILKEMEKPQEKKLPLKCTKRNKEKYNKNENIKYKNSVILIKRGKNVIKKLSEEIQSLEILNTNIENYDRSLDFTTKKISSLSLKYDEIEYKGDEHLDSLKNTLNKLLKTKKMQILKTKCKESEKTLEKMKEEEMATFVNNLKQIESTNWVDYTKNDVLEHIESYKELMDSSKKLELLQDKLNLINVDEKMLTVRKEELENIKIEIETKIGIIEKLTLQKEIYKCPNCSINVRFHNNCLYKISENDFDGSLDLGTVKNDVKKLKSRKAELEKLIWKDTANIEKCKKLEKDVNCIKDLYDEDLPSYKSCRDDYQFFVDYKDQQQTLEQQKIELENKIENKTFSKSINFLQNKLENDLKLLKNLETVEGCMENVDEETLRTEIENQKYKKQKIENIKNSIKVLEQEKLDCKNRIDKVKTDYINKYKKIRNFEDINQLISGKQEEISKHEQKGITCLDNIKRIEMYDEYIKKMEKYENWNRKVIKLKKEEQINKHKYSAAMILKEKILEAESAFVHNTISSINTHAQMYLDYFFPDEPISVNLMTFKTIKKGKSETKKPQINIEICYKDMLMDINMLSGGEQSRIVLAYALALSEIFNTPMMMLDECVSSLDQKLTEVVVAAIKENCKNKLIILVCHQVITGVFDKVISI